MFYFDVFGILGFQVFPCFGCFGGVLASDLLGNLTKACLNMRAVMPQKLIYVVPQGTWKLQIKPASFFALSAVWGSMLWGHERILLEQLKLDVRHHS